MSMKVERSSVEQVKQRFELLKRKKEEKNKDFDLSERIQEVKEEVKQIKHFYSLFKTNFQTTTGRKTQGIQKRKT